MKFPLEYEIWLARDRAALGDLLSSVPANPVK